MVTIRALAEPDVPPVPALLGPVAEAVVLEPGGELSHGGHVGGAQLAAQVVEQLGGGDEGLAAHLRRLEVVGQQLVGGRGGHVGAVVLLQGLLLVLRQPVALALLEGVQGLCVELAVVDGGVGVYESASSAHRTAKAGFEKHNKTKENRKKQI